MLVAVCSRNRWMRVTFLRTVKFASCLMVKLGRQARPEARPVMHEVYMSSRRSTARECWENRPCWPSGDKAQKFSRQQIQRGHVVGRAGQPDCVTSLVSYSGESGEAVQSEHIGQVEKSRVCTFVINTARTTT